MGPILRYHKRGGNLARRALERLEFHVHIDSVETPTARFADYLLPANTPWEREGLRIGFEISQNAESLVQLRQPALPSAGQSLSDAQIVFRLAPHIGLSDLFFNGNLDRARDAQLSPSGLTVDDLRRAPEGITVQQEYRPPKYTERQGNGLRGFRICCYSQPCH